MEEDVQGAFLQEVFCVLSNKEAVQRCGRIPGGRIGKCETQERNVGGPDVFRTQGVRRRSQADAGPHPTGSLKQGYDTITFVHQRVA